MTPSPAGGADLDPPAATSAIARRFGNLSTDVKLLAILSLALLPLGLIALLASLQSARTGDERRVAYVNVTTSELARKLAKTIASDEATVRMAERRLARGADGDATCAQLRNVMSARPEDAVTFSLLAVDGSVICTNAAAFAVGPPDFMQARTRTAKLGAQSLTVMWPTDGVAYWGVVSYPRSALAQILKPVGATGPYSLTLQKDASALTVVESSIPLLHRAVRGSADLGIYDLSLAMAIDGTPFGTADLVLAFLPLLMWASAAGVVFFVVDRLLTRPLVALREAVAEIRPGERFAVPNTRTLATEIRDLATTIARFGDAAVAHERALSQALSDQRLLTREVHHRVKNNLQVIASLISLHARVAKSPEVGAAYLSIQRRVDALSIVHRNHFAELEDNVGVALRTLLSEVAANLRAGGDGSRASIALDVDVAYVTQDVAIPIAFIVTELFEMMSTIDPNATMMVSVGNAGDEDPRPVMAIASSALRKSELYDTLMAERYGRVLQGLSRQLRTQIDYDPDGIVRIRFPVRIGSPQK